MEITRDQLRKLSDQAYAMGVTAATDEQRGYARGIEELADYLRTGQVTGRIDRLLSQVEGIR